MDLEATWLQDLSMQQLTGQVTQLRGSIPRQQLPQQRQLLHLRVPSCCGRVQGNAPILLILGVLGSILEFRISRTFYDIPGCITMIL